MRNHRQLQRSQNFVISDPVEELNRISNEEEHARKITNNASPKFNLHNKQGSPKIFNKKLPAGFESTEELSQWVGLSKKQKSQQINQPKLKNQNNRKQPEKAGSTFQFEDWLKNRNINNEDQILSFRDLCHRYTFINQHSSFSQLSVFESEYVNKKELHPKNVELKLQAPEQYMMSKYKAPPKFKRASENNEDKVRLPQLLKIESQGQKTSNFDNSEEVKNILQLIRKSTSRTKFESKSTKKKQKVERSQSIIHERQQNFKQKINWKANQRYQIEIRLAKMQETGGARPSRYDKAVRHYSPLSFNQHSLLGQKSQEKDKKGSLARQKNRISKSLQECLILSKKH